MDVIKAGTTEVIVSALGEWNDRYSSATCECGDTLKSGEITVSGARYTPGVTIESMYFYHIKFNL